MINTESLGWGVTTDEGVEIWDANPTVRHDPARCSDWVRLLFYPKKIILYLFLLKNIRASANRPFRILDVGCGTGSALIDMKRLFGSRVEIVGADVVELQVELAKKKIVENRAIASVEWYDGSHLPFAEDSLDAIYTSDVLGHVQDVPLWLAELSRVLKSGGALAMFSESSLGKHAYIRRYLASRGVNADPHAQYHISLYGKSELRNMLDLHGFQIERMYGVFWLAFMLHPEEYVSALQNSDQFPILCVVNRALAWIKQKTYPIGTVFAELYGLLEMITIGRFLESQGYVILGRKK